MVKDCPAGLEKGAHRKRLLWKYEIRLKLRFQPVIKKQNRTDLNIHMFNGSCIFFSNLTLKPADNIIIEAHNCVHRNLIAELTDFPFYPLFYSSYLPNLVNLWITWKLNPPAVLVAKQTYVPASSGSTASSLRVLEYLKKASYTYLIRERLSL